MKANAQHLITRHTDPLFGVAQDTEDADLSHEVCGGDLRQCLGEGIYEVPRSFYASQKLVTTYPGRYAHVTRSRVEGRQTHAPRKPDSEVGKNVCRQE